MALIEAVRGRFAIPQRWYRLKAQLLGVDKLADYDRAAPLPGDEASFSYGEARELVLDTYHAFSGEAGHVVRRFFDEHWIDAPVRDHKRGGAFCAYTVPSVHPYVLLNFTAQRRDVLTMAHELGHGLHAALSQGQGVFHHSTPLDPRRDRLGVRRGAHVRPAARRRRRTTGRACTARRPDRRRDRHGVPADGDEPLRAPRPHRPAHRGRAVGRPLRGALGADPGGAVRRQRRDHRRATAPGGPTSPTSSTRPATSTPTRTASCSRCRSTTATSQEGESVRAPLPRAARPPAAREPRGARRDRRHRPRRPRLLGRRASTWSRASCATPRSSPRGSSGRARAGCGRALPACRPRCAISRRI